METQVLLLHADKVPLSGISNPGSHQIYKNPNLTLENRTLAQLHPDVIRVKMLYAGVCGTDLHFTEKNPHTGYIRSSAPANIPPEGRVIGHEGVGRILEQVQMFSICRQGCNWGRTKPTI